MDRNHMTAEYTGWQSETLAEQADNTTGCPAMLLWTYLDYTTRLTLISTACGQGRQWGERNWGQDVASDRGGDETVLQRADRMNSSTMAAGWVWGSGISPRDFSLSLFPRMLTTKTIKNSRAELMFSYHYLEHRAEDLGVLRHATYVEHPGEDRRVVILILNIDVHLGRVSCKKEMEQYRCSRSLVVQGKQKITENFTPVSVLECQ